GFNKSHSAAYAYLAYQTAYLKAHFPAHFMSALLTSEAEKGDTDQIIKYINECRELGLTILPPDVNSSHYHFSVEGQNIRMGLSAVKNVGENTVKEIIALREKKGGFKNLFDLFEEYDSRILNRKALESLIKAGAFDSLGWKRAQLFESIDSLLEYGRQKQRAREESALSLFGDEYLPAPEIPPNVLTINEWDDELRLAYEKEVLGTYLSSHPLVSYRSRLPAITSHTIEALDPEKDFDLEVRLAGIVISIKPLRTKKEERMATMVLEDLTGKVDVTVFPEAFNKFNHYLLEGQIIWLKGKMQADSFESKKIIASQIMPLAEAFEKLARKITVNIPVEALSGEDLEHLKQILAAYPGDCPLYLQLESPSSTYLIQSAEFQKVFPSGLLVDQLEGLFGPGAVHLEY
ncbi:MAG TPA: DNA polymerase III subunit alpha, partial [Acidobacteria bacterium]|nr:DNA polymerase III subunit alpha [Acidobacteriota bacterium]